MFPSNDSYNPFSYTNENPNSRQEQPVSLFSYFPCPFLDQDESSVPQQQQQQLMLADDTEANIGDSITSNTSNVSDGTLPKMKKSNPPPPRRAGKKDRHSKIHTAQGLRDRRMRLSLPIARKFFDLQDILGFDKASKTIEWLFTKSKVAIKEVMNSCTTASTTGTGGRIAYESLVASGDKKKRKLLYNPRARESRDMARARARERTREKIMIRRSLEQCNFGANPKILGFSTTPFEAGGEEDHQLDIIETFLGTPSSSTSCSILDHNNNINITHQVVVSAGGVESKNWESLHFYSPFPSL